MITNSQKRAGGGQSLATTSVTVTQAVTAGQDLFVNEAGDIAPSTWFTGTPTFLDNTGYTYISTTSFKTICGDVCTFDSDNAYVAYITGDFTSGGTVADLHVRKVNPLTGELLNTATVSLTSTLGYPGESTFWQRMYVQVVPVSATVVGVVVSYVTLANSHNLVAMKFTTSGTTFTNGGWTAVTSTAGVATEIERMPFSGVTGTANRWGYLVKTITWTTAVAYIYKHASNSITPVTLSFATSADRGNAFYCIKEGSDDLLYCHHDNNLSSVNIRAVIGSSATVVAANTVNLTSNFTSITGFISTSSTQLMLSGLGPALVGAKRTARMLAVTINAGVTVATPGTMYHLPLNKIPASTTLYLAMYANGQYIFSSASKKRWLLQPPDGQFQDQNIVNFGTIWTVKGTATVPSILPADMAVSYVPASAKIEEANWAPAATKRLRLIYCAYYRGLAGTSGFGAVVDSAPLRCDFPWLFMPEFNYGTSKNALTYLGSAVGSIAANAAGTVLLGTGAVKLNGNISPVKTIKNGVIAINSIWGIKLPPGQRNESGMDPVATNSATVANDFAGAGQGNAMELGAWAGVGLYIENQKGSAVLFTQGFGSSTPSDQTYSVMACVDGRVFSMSMQHLPASVGALRNEFSFSDHLFFTFSDSYSRGTLNATPGTVFARAITTNLESRYHE